MAKKKRAKSTAIEAPTYQRSVNVDVDKAKNGYVISTYGERGQVKYIAKTKKEAMNYANKLLEKGAK